MSKVIRSYLEQMETQREEVFLDLKGIQESRLWERPLPTKWSAGEHLDHTRVLNRFFRVCIQLLWPLFRPIAKLRCNRAYETQIDNVYQRPNMPSNVGVLWPPHYRPQRPISLAGLHDALASEHQRIARFFGPKDEHLLGNSYLWDPVIGWLNLIQVLRVGVYHDQHHYSAVRRLLQL